MDLVRNLTPRNRLQLIRSVNGKKDWLPQVYMLRVWDVECFNKKFSTVALVQLVPCTDESAYYFSDCVRLVVGQNSLAGLPVRAAVDEVGMKIYLLYGKEPFVRVYHTHIISKTSKGHNLLRAMVAEDPAISTPITLKIDTSYLTVGHNFKILDLSFQGASAVLTCHFTTKSLQWSPTHRNTAICSAVSVHNGDKIKSFLCNVTHGNGIYYSPSHLCAFGGSAACRNGGYMTLSKFLTINTENHPTEGKISFNKYDADGALCARKFYDPLSFLSFIGGESLVRKVSDSVGAQFEPFYSFVTKTIQLLAFVDKNTFFSIGRSLIIAARIDRDCCTENPSLKMISLSFLVDSQSPQSSIQQSILLKKSFVFKLLDTNGNVRIRILDVDQTKYKRYRSCAFCKKEEKHKRRNRIGKRIANWKICRTCKELGYKHLQNFPVTTECYYCSYTCIQKDWKHHKQLHKPL